MSVVSCNNCMNQVDTDRVEVLVVLDKYYYCDDCTGRDEIFEILDELQSELDKKTRQCNGLIKSLANAHNELRCVYDSAKQGLEFLGVKP